MNHLGLRPRDGWRAWGARRRVGQATRRAITGITVIAGTLSAGTTNAQTVAIVGGTVYPVSGPRIEHGTVLIRDGRIVGVGGTVQVPDGATTIDASGKWVTPGLVNAVSSLGLVEVDAVDETRDNAAHGMNGIAAGFAAIAGLNPASQLIPPARAGGVTSVVTMPNGLLVSGQAAFIDLVAGPVSSMVVRAPAAVVAEAGNAAQAGLGARGEVLGRLRELLDDARAYQQRRSDYDHGRMRPLSAGPRDLAALVPVLARQEPLVIFADRASDIQSALRLASDYHLELVIAGGAEAWELADALAAAKVPVLTGTMSNIPSSFSTLGQRHDNAAILRRAGVSVVIVGNGDVEDQEALNTRNIAQDAGTAVAYGLSWDDALRAVTLAPALAFGVADRVGSLAPGREANVVVWSGDPFELNTRAEHVFVRGREYRDALRQDLLTDRYKTLPPSYQRP